MNFERSRPQVRLGLEACRPTQQSSQLGCRRILHRFVGPMFDVFRLLTAVRSEAGGRSPALPNRALRWLFQEPQCSDDDA